MGDRGRKIEMIKLGTWSHEQLPRNRCRDNHERRLGTARAEREPPEPRSKIAIANVVASL